MVGPVRFELTNSHAPGANLTKLDHGPETVSLTDSPKLKRLRKPPELGKWVSTTTSKTTSHEDPPRARAS